MKHLLEVDNISVSFATPHGQVEAVHGVSFYIDEGETVGIVGESGCGKSVTSQTVMKLLPPSVSKLTSGRIIWDGFNIENFSEREMNTLRGKDMAMVFQDPMTSLNPVLTVGEQIEEGLRLHLHLSKKEAAEEAVRLLQSVGISGASQRVRSYPHELSGGMRQRCLIAAAIACKPRLLFADEPTTALDVTTEAQVLNVLQQMQEDLHMAVLLISHNLGVIARMCRRVYVMYAGTVVEEATTERLFDEPAHPYTKGLLSSLPALHDKGEILKGIGGQAPDLFHLPQGCRFFSRCRDGMRICERLEPPTFDLGKGQKASCWLYSPERSTSSCI